MKTGLLLATCSSLAACAPAPPPATQWIGPLTATDSSQCPPTKGVLVRRGATVTFAPDEGVWILTGTASGDDILAARTETQRNHAYSTKFTAHRDGDTLRGTYTTPTCRYQAELHRV